MVTCPGSAVTVSDVDVVAVTVVTEVVVKVPDIDSKQCDTEAVEARPS